MTSAQKSSRSQRRLVEELPEILADRQLSIRALARSRRQPVTSGRVLHQRDYKTPSAELCQRLAHALDLPDDYWPEYRERVVMERVRSDPELRQELYRLTARGGRSTRRRS